MEARSISLGHHHNWQNARWEKTRNVSMYFQIENPPDRNKRERSEDKLKFRANFTADYYSPRLRHM